MSDTIERLGIDIKQWAEEVRARIAAASEKAASSNAPTLRIPYDDPCSHTDMCGDSTIEAIGHDRWCVACGKRWQDTDVVIVNDEVAHGS